MAVQNITTLKSYFETGDVPTEAQYIDVFDTIFSFLKTDGSNAASDIDIGAYKMNAQGFSVKGTGGNGHVSFKFQSSDATAAANETSLFANPSGNIKWKIDGGFYATLVTSGISADRVYTLQNGSGTLAFTSDLTGGTVTSVATGTGLTGGTITGTGTISLSTALQPIASLTGNSLKVLRVNAGETAVEWATITTSSALSGLTAAGATNTIDNTLYAQTWNWSTLTTQTALALSANALTTGKVFDLSVTGTAHTSGYVMNVATSGANASASTTTAAAYFKNNRTGTTNTNICAVFEASGAANSSTNELNIQTKWVNDASNYAQIVVNYQGNVFFNQSGNGGATTSNKFQFNSLSSANNVWVGIGTVAESALTIRNSSTYNYIQFNNSSNTAKAYFGISATNGNIITGDTAGDTMFRCEQSFLLATGGNNLALYIPSATRNVGIGTGTTVSARLHVISTTEQLRVGYNATNYWNATTASTAVTTFDITAGSGNPYFVFAKGVSMPYTAKTTTYAATLSDYTIDCTANSFTVTLPTAVGHNILYNIKNSGNGTITVATTSSQTIDGQTTQTVLSGNNMTVQSNGANWIIL